MNGQTNDLSIAKAIELPGLHYDTFSSVVELARLTGHPVPVDTRAWSQILVSVLTGIKGLEQKKGADLDDGSDVKGALTWAAIDTPRFNGVIKAGTRAATSDRIESLDAMPFLFLVLWDNAPDTGNFRCRIWCVRPQVDRYFREMCELWYAKVGTGEIKSTNFQLHPPRNKNSDEIRNTCGNLVYPLFFHAERSQSDGYSVRRYDQEVMRTGLSSLSR